MTRVIDLRSDTVSRPSEGMRQAMAAAEVGDDVFGDDPTVIELERRAAELLGKGAALVLPSGTMANLVAVMSHTRPGDEILLGDQSHTVQYELGGVARLAGTMTRTLANLMAFPSWQDAGLAIAGEMGEDLLLAVDDIGEAAILHLLDRFENACCVVE